jgi:LmbE family N-acetylglucosaminyl deacetylase
MRVLVIAPHADDEVYGMGGTILKLVDQGHDVMTLAVCCGSSYEFEHLGASVPRSVRQEEFRKAAEMMGASHKMLDFTEESLMDTVPIRNVVMGIEAVQDELNADRWYVAGPSFHQDHRVVFEAAMAAARPSRTNVPNDVFLYETALYSWSPECWKLKPHVYENVEQYLDRKIEVCGVYESQLRESGPISPNRLREWAMACGSEIGVGAAERFEIVRIVR